MPDLKSELKKLENLRFDDDGEDTTPTTTTEEPPVNMTHQVFYYYVDHPMSTVNDCAAALGFNASRVAALSLQLLGRNLLTRKKVGDQPFVYTATTKKMPDTAAVKRAALIKAHEVRKANAAKRRADKAKAAKKAAKQTTQPQPQEPAKQKPATGFNAALLVGGLTPFQAKAVFDELKKLFGG